MTVIKVNGELHLEELVLKSGDQVIGEGVENSTLILKKPITSREKLSGITISNLSISSPARCIDFKKGLINSVINNVKMTDCASGINIEASEGHGVYFNHFSNISIGYNGTGPVFGFRIITNKNPMRANVNTFVNCSFRFCLYGLILDRCHSTNIIGCNFEANNKNGLLISGSKSTTLTGGHFEQNGADINLLKSESTALIRPHLASETKLAGDLGRAGDVYLLDSERGGASSDTFEQNFMHSLRLRQLDTNWIRLGGGLIRGTEDGIEIRGKIKYTG